ncbi:MAG: hypothetical protein E7638_04955 [Ruminococcaceae bacterium]|nr:hypothetical protein [Oscillospiraceae bacterium]
MKENIKFIAKLVLVVVLSFAVLYPINLLYKGGQTYGGTFAGMDKFDKVPTEIEYANFGPSYGMNCFDYESLEAEGKTCFNFALTMQSIYHDYEVYKAYKDHFSEGAIVAVPLSYFSFTQNLSAVSSARYYKILDKDAIKGYTPENDFSAKYMPVYGKGSSLIRDLVDGLLDDIMLSTVESDEESPNTTVEASRETELKNDSNVRVRNVVSGNFEAFDEYIAETEEILVNWLEDMKEAGLRPVLVLTPYWIDYAKGFETEALAHAYTEPMQRVVEKTGIPYIDFNSDEYIDYITTPDYFNNCDHVSPEGGKAFMELFTAYVNEEMLP